MATSAPEVTCPTAAWPAASSPLKNAPTGATITLSATVGLCKFQHTNAGLKPTPTARADPRTTGFVVTINYYCDGFHIKIVIV